MADLGGRFSRVCRPDVATAWSGSGPPDLEKSLYRFPACARSMVSVDLPARAYPRHDDELCGRVHSEYDSPATDARRTPAGIPSERFGMVSVEGIACEDAKPIPHPFLVSAVEPGEVGGRRTVEPNLVGHLWLQVQPPLHLVKRDIIAAGDLGFCLLHFGALLFCKRVVLFGEEPTNVVQHLGRAVRIEFAYQLEKLIFRCRHNADSAARTTRMVHISTTRRVEFEWLDEGKG